jgi:hypothetical protein
MLFKPSNNSDLPMLKYELSSPEINGAAFDAALQEAVGIPHGFLYIDKTSTPYKYFSSFREELSSTPPE